ncbi:hypothetical protein E3N88_26066 [Mikania micrantha]|uniref:Uncharacterized protein n=1 Tax=Mikania micrantha TaxID=192012 RepID=A0A5N6N716_9ASTR|nr:hypothetical protein E3N88_26066 [Mikania micrantha]
MMNGSSVSVPRFVSHGFAACNGFGQVVTNPRFVSSQRFVCRVRVRKVRPPDDSSQLKGSAEVIRVGKPRFGPNMGSPPKRFAHGREDLPPMLGSAIPKGSATRVRPSLLSGSTCEPVTHYHHLKLIFVEDDPHAVVACKPALARLRSRATCGHQERPFSLRNDRDMECERLEMVVRC